MKEKEPKKKKQEDEVFALARRINVPNPSQTDVEAFKKVLKEAPEIWRQTGDMMMQARETYIISLNTTALGRETMRLHIRELKKELTSENDGPLMNLLIDQVILCWLRLSVIEQQYTNVMKESHTLTLGIYWEKRLNAAHKRYQKACESLARVRKLLRPPAPNLQANIAILNAPTGIDQPGPDATGRMLKRTLRRGD